jgi:hypothetical protein
MGINEEMRICKRPASKMCDIYAVMPAHQYRTVSSFDICVSLTFINEACLSGTAFQKRGGETAKRKLVTPETTLIDHTDKGSNIQVILIDKSTR